MRAAILPLMATGAAAAQTITAAAELPGLPDVANALDPGDPELAICTSVGYLVGDCVDDPAFLQCACCVSGSPIANSYSVCSTYLESEASSDLAASATAFGSFYSYCEAATCDGSATGKGRMTTSAPSSPAACRSFSSIYESCSSATANFDNLANVDRASCLCCDDGSANNALGRYASTCKRWVKTYNSEQFEAYSTWAEFCNHFSDVCADYTSTKKSRSTEATKTADAEPTAEGETATGAGSDGSITFSVMPPSPTETDAAPQTRASLAGAFLVIVAALILL